MSALLSDARVSLRLLLKTKGFAVVSILLLAFGIGMNMTLFTIANCALFKPMTGVKHADMLAVVGRTQSGRGFDNTSWATYSDLRKGSQLFSDLAAFDLRPFSLAVDGRTERLMGAEVSENYFDTLGVKPSSGRLFRRDEGQKAGEDPVAVLSHTYWQSHFGSDLTLIGKSVQVNGHPFTIIGIAEKGFRGHEVRQGDLWVLIPTTTLFSNSTDLLNRYDFSLLVMVGRLKPNIDPRAAQREMDALFAGIQKAHPKEMKDQGIRVTPYHPLGQADIRDLAIQVFGVFGVLASLVLLSVCANLGGVVLARAMARQREFAVRLSLGATRFHLMRQMLVEAAMLTIPGALLGLLISAWIGDLFLTSLPIDAFTVQLDTVPDWRSLTVFMALCLFSILSFVTLPLWQTMRSNLQPALKSGENAVGLRKSWVREGLVFVQVFVSVVLLSGAGLLGMTLWNLSSVDLNMKPDHLLSVSINPRLNGYKDAASQDLYTRLQQRLESMPGIVSVSSTAMLPLAGGGLGIGSLYGGAIPKEDPIFSDASVVGPRYLETIGMSLLRGRDFQSSDTKNSQPVVILNQIFARKFFGDQDPIGRYLYLKDEAIKAMLVVGVAANASYRSIGESPRDMFFVPVRQFDFGQQSFLIRTRYAPLTMLDPVKAAISSLDPNLPVYDPKTMEMQLDQAAWPWRAMGLVAITSSALAALIAFVGLFGLIAWTVARRTREIGLKMALGAANKTILQETIWRGARAAIFAAITGFAFSLLAAGQLSEFLVGVNPRDPLLFLGIAFGFTLVVAAAILAPARRALTISPMEALRYE